MATTLEDLPQLSRPRIRVGAATLLVPAVLIYGVLFLWPLFQAFWSSITPQAQLSGQAYTAFFDSAFYRSVLWRSMRISVLTTIATALVGYPIAVYLSQSWRKGRSLVTLLVIAPMLVSAVVRSYGWIIILGPNGALSNIVALSGRAPGGYLLYSETGVIIALTHVFLPFMILAITGVLQQIDPALARAAQSLGANGLKTFFSITLPLSMPGITAGSVIVFCLSASAFVTPALVGGSRIPMMPYLVYKEGLLVFNWSFASAIAVILLVVTAVVTALYSFWSKRRSGGNL